MHAHACAGAPELSMQLLACQLPKLLCQGWAQLPKHPYPVPPTNTVTARCLGLAGPALRGPVLAQRGGQRWPSTCGWTQCMHRNSSMHVCMPHTSDHSSRHYGGGPKHTLVQAVPMQDEGSKSAKAVPTSKLGRHNCNMDGPKNRTRCAHNQDEVVPSASSGGAGTKWCQPHNMVAQSKTGGSIQNNEVGQQHNTGRPRQDRAVLKPKQEVPTAQRGGQVAPTATRRSQAKQHIPNRGAMQGRISGPHRKPLWT